MENRPEAFFVVFRFFVLVNRQTRIKNDVGEARDHEKTLRTVPGKNIPPGIIFFDRYGSSYGRFTKQHFYNTFVYFPESTQPPGHIDLLPLNQT